MRMVCVLLCVCVLFSCTGCTRSVSAIPRMGIVLIDPGHGGFDGGNKLMLNLPDNKTDSDKAIALAIQNKSLIFPAADVF